MKTRFQVWILISLALFILAGCSRGGSPVPATTEASAVSVDTQPVVTTADVELATSSPLPQTTDSGGAETPYPYPARYVYQTPTFPSYPVPRSGTAFYTPVPFVVPEPSADTGVVVGQMLDASTGEPMRFVYIYLGKKTFLTPGPGYTYTLQEKSSPHTQTDENGRFAIGDVPPGSYLLMIFTPRSASVVMEPNTDRERDIVVEAGKTLEVGEVEAFPPTY